MLILFANVRYVKGLAIQQSSSFVKGVMVLITATANNLHTRFVIFTIIGFSFSFHFQMSFISNCFVCMNFFQNVSHGPFLCPKHTKCHSCGSTVPGSGVSTRY
jgi:hypothetical protein